MLDLTFAPAVGQEVRLPANEDCPEEVAVYLGDGVLEVPLGNREPDDPDGLREMEFPVPGLWIPNEEDV